jgi:drug/metabolite transporter (DMT)-like permease
LASAEASPFAIAFYRMALSMPLITILFFKEITLPRHRFQFFAFAGGAIFGLDLILWHKALTLTSVSNATFLVGLAPLWVALTNRIFGSARFSNKFLIGLSLCLSGAFILALGSELSFAFSLGESIALLASFCYAGFTMLFAKARQVCERGEALFYTVLGAGSVSLIGMLATEGLTRHYSLHTWLSLAGLALVVQVLAWTIISTGMREVKSSEGSVALLMQQVATLFLGVIILGELLSLFDYLGSALILVGLISLAIPNRPIKTLESECVQG